jgi:hypothetical protein
LILISPIGIRVAPESEDGSERNDDALYGKDFGPPEWLRPIISYLWTNRMSIFSLGRILGEYTSKE